MCLGSPGCYWTPPDPDEINLIEVVIHKINEIDADEYNQTWVDWAEDWLAQWIEDNRMDTVYESYSGDWDDYDD